MLVVGRLSTPPKDFCGDLPPFLELRALLDVALALGQLAPSDIAQVRLLLFLIPLSECFLR